MAFDVSALSSYTTPGDELIAKAINVGQTMRYVTVVPGIKSSQYVNTNYSTVVFNSGTNCGWNPSATTTVGQVLLTVDPISLQEKFCIKDFDTKSLQNKLKPGSTGNDVQVVTEFMDEKSQAIGYEKNKMILQGNKASGSGNLARVDGIFYQLLHTSSSASTVSATSAVTSSNILTVVDWVVQNIPSEVLNRTDLKLVMTSTNYRYYINALRNANAFLYGGEAGSNWSTKIPGYEQIEVICDTAMDGNADGIDMFLTYPDNIKIGTDLDNEEEKFELWWSQDNREIRLDVGFKLGTKVVFPQFVVIIK